VASICPIVYQKNCFFGNSIFSIHGHWEFSFTCAIRSHNLAKSQCDWTLKRMIVLFQYCWWVILRNCRRIMSMKWTSDWGWKFIKLGWWMILDHIALSPLCMRSMRRTKLKWIVLLQWETLSMFADNIPKLLIKGDFQKKWVIYAINL